MGKEPGGNLETRAVTLALPPAHRVTSPELFLPFGLGLLILKIIKNMY